MSSAAPVVESAWGERVLLVENAAAQNEMAQMLGGLGYDVQIAPDSQSALQMWRSCSTEARPHLILADVKMPQDGGLELLRQVRSDDPHLPVVLVMERFSNAPLVDALRLRADDFLAKPIALAELKGVLDRALEARRNRLACEQEAARAARLQAVLETAIAVNHEINNPLATISASAQLLRHHLQLNANLDEMNRDAMNDDANTPQTPRAAATGEAPAQVATTDGATREHGDEAGDMVVMLHLLDVIIEQCERIACFNRKLNKVVNPVTRLSGGQKMLDVDGSRSQ